MTGEGTVSTINKTVIMTAVKSTDERSSYEILIPSPVEILRKLIVKCPKSCCSQNTTVHIKTDTSNLTMYRMQCLVHGRS